jgi:hypothetical protein
MIEKDTHIHCFKEIVIKNVMADDPKKRHRNSDFVGYGRDLPTLGRTKPMALLARKCDCGKEESFEYGDRKEMQKLFKELNDAIKNTVQA